MNPELENIRGALWRTYFDLKEERISVEEAFAADALLSTLGQCLQLELEQAEALKKKPPRAAREEENA